MKMSLYTSIQFHIRGIAPLLLHNGQLADPMNPHSKAMKVVSGKRKKTDEDYAAMKRLEWIGSLYVNEKMQPVIPGVNIEAMMIEAGKDQKMGEPFKAGVLCDGEWPIIYDGPKTIEALWESGNFIDVRGVRVQTSRVMRTRPIFRSWELKFKIDYLPDVLNESQVREAVVTAGRKKGLCDYTPKFGRFEVVA